MIKQIPGYPDYEVSEYGDVFSNKFGKIKKLKATIDRDGYSQVALCINGNPKTRKVHRLVLMTFDRMPKNGEVCRHLDGDPSYNYYKNLQWGTQQDNVDDMWKVHKTGSLPPVFTTENHPMCKLSKEQIQKIRELYATGNFYHRILAEKYNVSRVHIGRIINNKLRAVK